MTTTTIPTKRFHMMTWVAGVVSALLLLGAGGTAAALRLEAAGDTIRMPGIEVGGVELAGLSADQAQDAFERQFAGYLDDPITVSVNGEYARTATRRELGVSADVSEAYRQGLEIDRELSLPARLWHRITGIGLGRSLAAATTVDEDQVAEYVRLLAAEVNREAVDSALVTSGSRVRVTGSTTGFVLDEESALEALTKVAQGDGNSVDLKGRAISPAVTEESFDDLIVVKVGENRLYHYENDKLVKTYTVATGLPRYPTPIGRFEITLKRFRPTWVNPATGPGRWGENLPARIGPGPQNPLGTRAMNINSPGIRIHGTSTVSSLGYNASHGCIRMKMSDVEELFDRVEVGTPVIIEKAGPPRLTSSRSATPTVEELVESDGAAAEGPTAGDPTAPAPPALAPPALAPATAPAAAPQTETRQSLAESEDEPEASDEPERSTVLPDFPGIPPIDPINPKRD